MVNKFYADIGGQGISSVTEGEGRRPGETVRSRGWASPRRPPEGNMLALGVALGPAASENWIVQRMDRWEMEEGKGAIAQPRSLKNKIRMPKTWAWTLECGYRSQSWGGLWVQGLGLLHQRIPTLQTYAERATEGNKKPRNEQQEPRTPKGGGHRKTPTPEESGSHRRAGTEGVELGGRGAQALHCPRQVRPRGRTTGGDQGQLFFRWPALRSALPLARDSPTAWDYTPCNRIKHRSKK